MRILVVDDEPIILELVEAILARPGVRVDTAGTCRKGLSLVAANQYDWAVLDYRLPDGTGLDILKALRASRPATRSIMMTGDIDSPFLKEEALALGAVEVVAKPLFARKLTRHIFGPASPQPRQNPDASLVESNGET